MAAALRLLGASLDDVSRPAADGNPRSRGNRHAGGTGDLLSRRGAQLPRAEAAVGRARRGAGGPRDRAGRSRGHHAAQLPAVHHRGVRDSPARRRGRQHQPELHGARVPDGRDRLGHARAGHTRRARAARPGHRSQTVSNRSSSRRSGSTARRGAAAARGRRADARESRRLRSRGDLPLSRSHPTTSRSSSTPAAPPALRKARC